MTTVTVITKTKDIDGLTQNQNGSDTTNEQLQEESCGNGTCDLDLDETNENCPPDCPKPVCGNGICEPVFNETNENCPSDCF